MPIATSWIVEIGDRSGWSDFADRTFGLQTSQQLTVGRFASFKCQVSMLNNDGALSPDAGGTYATVDWFSQAIRVRATVTDGTNTETVQVFAGMITDFQLNDDGVNSFVTLAADDMFTIAGRQVFDGENVQLSASPDDQIFEMYNNVTGFTSNPVVLPNLASLDGSPSTAFVVDASLNYQSTTTVVNYNVGRNLKGVVNNEIMPSGPSIGWPTTLGWFDYDVGTDQENITFNGFMVDRTFTRKTTDDDYSALGEYDDGRDIDKTAARTFTFDGTPTGTELPFRSIERAWAMDDVINSAIIEGQFPTTLTPQSATSSTSTTNYGRRAVQFLDGANNSDADALTAAQLWANRFDTPRFAPRTISLTASQVRATAANAAYESWVDLLDIESGLFNRATVVYTPTGSSTPLTAQTVIMGRTVAISTADTTVTLDLVPLEDFSSFILDSSTLGVLDQNRLG